MKLNMLISLLGRKCGFEPDFVLKRHFAKYIETKRSDYCKKHLKDPFFNFEIG